MRKIRIASTQFDLPKTIETDIDNWGDLQPLLLDNGINHAGMTATLSPDNVNLVRGDAALPEGEVIIFLSPSKVASGDGDINSANEDSLVALSYNVLRSFASKNDIDLSGNPSKLQIVARVASFNAGLNGQQDTSNSELVTTNNEEVVKEEVINNEEVVAANTSLREALKAIAEIANEAVKEDMIVSDEDRNVMEKFNEFRSN